MGGERHCFKNSNLLIKWDRNIIHIYNTVPGAAFYAVTCNAVQCVWACVLAGWLIDNSNCLESFFPEIASQMEQLLCNFLFKKYHPCCKVVEWISPCHLAWNMAASVTQAMLNPLSGFLLNKVLWAWGSAGAKKKKYRTLSFLRKFTFNGLWGFFKSSWKS